MGYHDFRITIVTILNLMYFLYISYIGFIVTANFAKKCIFLCFSVKHASFDINLKNGLIVNCLCER
jgi:hypothetical protein